MSTRRVPAFCGQAAIVTSAALAGVCQGQTPPPVQATRPAAVQPQGWIVFASTADGDAELYRCRPDGTERTQITDNRDFDGSPSCSPDGAHIAFISDRDGQAAVYVAGRDGKDARRIAECGDKHARITWSPDGRRIAFDVTTGTSLSIHVADVAAAGSTQLIADGMWPAWSPDGRTIVFNRGNMPHMFLADADGSNVRALLKGETEILPDLAPFWSIDGTRVFYTAVTGAGGTSMAYEIRSVTAEGTDLKAIQPISESVAVATAPDGGGWLLFSSDKAGDVGLRLLNPADKSIHKVTDDVIGPWAGWCK